MADDDTTMEIPAGFTKEDVELARQLVEEERQEKEQAQPVQQSEPEQPAAELEEQEPQGDPVETTDETVTETEERDVSPSPYLFSVKGEDKEFTKEQIQHMLSREQTFQQKFTSLRESETTKLGMLMEAAKKGDAGAQKRVLAELKEMTNSDVYELEDVEQDFDLDKHVEEQTADAEDVDAFADVVNDVDYEKTLDKMKEQFPSRMPPKLFQSYWDNPAERRVMYDLAKSGRVDEIFDALDGELNQMPLADRIKIKQDPDAYALAVVEAINGLNAPQQPAPPKDLGQTELDAVSTGQSSHRQEKEESLPDFSRMTDKEFKEYQVKHFGKVL